MNIAKGIAAAGGLALLMAGSAGAQVAQPGAGAAPAQAADRPAGDAPGPIDNLNDLQDTGRMVFKMADTNNDGQISQKEAVDAGNLLVGGFFFRADANGDGTLTQDEAKAARESLFAQQPLLRYIATQAKDEAKQQGATPNETNPAKAIGALLDSNNDKQLQASELRQMVQTVVQGGFATADTNRDGQMSPVEINAAIVGVARTAAQAAFQQADADRNNALSRQEFDKAIIEPANMVFAILDADNDGQLSQQEAERAREVLGSQLRMLFVQEPGNSARNLIRTGARPDQVAPVPNIPATPRAPGQ